MKHIFKQLGATALALAVTVCGVTALGANAASGPSPVGYTENGTTYYSPLGTTEEPETEPASACVDGIFENCYVTAPYSSGTMILILSFLLKTRMTATP